MCRDTCESICLGDRVKVALGGGAELASQSKVQGVMWHRGSHP